MDNAVRTILLLRSADMKTSAEALDALAEKFPGARIFLLAQRGVLSAFRQSHPAVELVEYPYRDFNMACPRQGLAHVPAVDLALALYKNDGAGYAEVDAFLLARIASREYGHVTGAMTVRRGVPSTWRRLESSALNTLRLYGFCPLAALRSRLFSRRYCPPTSRVVFSRDSGIRIDPGARFEMAEQSVCRIGYVPPDWEQVRDVGRARVRVHSGGALRLDGSSNLFGGVRINVFPQAECRVGEGSYVAFNSRIFCEKSVRIGSNCAISWDVEIMDTDFHRTVMQDAGVGRSGIVIGDHAWIGAGARILKGVELGSNVVVGAGSVVTKSFEDNAIVAGNPARVIGRKEGCVRV